MEHADGSEALQQVWRVDITNEGPFPQVLALVITESKSTERYKQSITLFEAHCICYMIYMIIAVLYIIASQTSRFLNV